MEAVLMSLDTVDVIDCPECGLDIHFCPMCGSQNLTAGGYCMGEMCRGEARLIFCPRCKEMI
jgi:hypothetical protein